MRLDCGQNRLRLIYLVCAVGPKNGRTALIDAKEHVGLQRAGAARYVRTHVTDLQNQRNTIRHRAVGQPVAVLYPHVGGKGTQKHRRDKDTGAATNLCFQSHLNSSFARQRACKEVEASGAIRR